MVMRRWVFAVLVGVAAAGPASRSRRLSLPLRVVSPDGKNVVTVSVREGSLWYSVDRDGKPILLPSRLGFDFRGAPPLGDSVRIVDSARTKVDETWTQPWGEVARVRDQHNELRVTAEETTSRRRRFVVAFRAFDDGVAFRYELPEQPGLGDFEIMDERTEFTFADNARAWWIPSNKPRLDRSEFLYAASPLSTLDSIQTPVTLELARRPHGGRDPRSEPRGLSANVPRRSRDGEPHAARGAGADGRWREGARAHAVSDAVANDPDREHA